VALPRFAMPRPRAPRRSLLIAGLLIAALVIRVEYVQHTAYKPINDARSYMSLGSQVATSGDYTSPHGAGGTRGPTAYFPPAYPYVIGGLEIIDGHTAGGQASVHATRLGQAVLGTVAVGLIGLVALEAFGPTVALVALTFGAVYPVFVELGGTLVAENLLVVFELVAVWAALRAGHAQRPKGPNLWVAAAGFFTGLATLAHENAILMIPPLVAAVWTTRPRLSRRSIAAPALLLSTTADHASRHLQPRLGSIRACPVQVAPVLRDSGRARADQAVDAADRAAALGEAPEPGAPLHSRASGGADRGRLPQHAAAVRARGILRVESIGDRDRAVHGQRADRRLQLLGHVRPRAARRVHRRGAPRPEMDLGRPAAAGVQRRARERRDAALPRAG